MPNTSVAPDDTDLQIIDLLSTEGRLTVAAMAERLSLSRSLVQRRLRGLERQRVIRGYRAVLDPDVVERRPVVFLEVEMADRGTNSAAHVEQALRSLDGLISLHCIAGHFDYLVRIYAQSINAVDNLLHELRNALRPLATVRCDLATATLVDRLTDVYVNSQ